MGSNIHLPAAVAEVFITDELSRRQSAIPDYLREKLAIQDLARHMADSPAEMLPRLVQLAMEICDADSAGVSVLEGAVFRWLGLKGKLSAFESATTPRDFSPCGVCIDYRAPILMERPERAYGWIADAKITVPEVLLVPLTIEGGELLGTLWVVAKDGSHFDAGHARVVSELATFTGIALRMIQADARLKKALAEQETLTREMSHRITNLFAIFDGMIRMTSRSAQTKQDLAQTLSGRVSALANANALVRRSLDPHAETKVTLAEVIALVLRAHGEPILDGPEIILGEHAAQNLALVLHELATNAAKYGALSSAAGSLALSWGREEDALVLDWNESGGPEITAPSKTGFGSTLLETTISRHHGTIERDWAKDGLKVRIRLPLADLAR